jgi:large subunit ribosomal protein L20
MPRAKRGFKARRRRNRVLDHAEGFWGSRSRLFGIAIEVVHKAWQYAYIGRKLRKRDFRRLWISRINAAARINGTTYSRLMCALKEKSIDLDRKILADLAVSEPAAFAEIAKTATAAAAGKSAKSVRR